MNDVETAKIWNTRLKECLEGHYSQESFANALTEAKNINSNDQTAISQQTVSRWLNVGGRASHNTYIGFPSFKNMLLIANVLHVDLGYLIGETDEKNFELEKACSYLHLNSGAIESIRGATDESSSYKTTRLIYTESRQLLNSILSSRSFYRLIQNMGDFVQLEINQKKQEDILQNLELTLGKTLLNEAFELEHSNVDFEHNDSIYVRPELRSAIQQLRSTESERETLTQSYRYDYKVFRYELNESFTQLMNELYPQI